MFGRGFSYVRQTSLRLTNNFRPTWHRQLLIGAAGLGVAMQFHQNSQTQGTVEREEAKRVVDSMQALFVNSLEKITLPETGENSHLQFRPVSWQRGEHGKYGGGTRFEIADTAIFNRASVNVSQVEYDSVPNCPVKSATAMSVILHPRNPYAPSMHFHISWTEVRGKKGSWRLMADLNPSIPDASDKAKFDKMFEQVVPAAFLDLVKDFGDRYFAIPVLGRTRGVSHLFFGELNSDTMSDCESRELAEKLARHTIAIYTKLVQDQMIAHPQATITEQDRHAQIDYHTAYMLQVLSLDRGTTHGLLAHADNDVGTLGSIPNVINRELLASWVDKHSEPQRSLVQGMVDTLPDEKYCFITRELREKLANVCRNHYQTHPEALDLQADMDMKAWAQKLAKTVEY